MIRTTLLLAAFLLTLLPHTAASQTAGDLFQQAMTLERSQGDIRGAMAIYERIVTEFPEDRTVAASALLQLGKGYERTGRDDARGVYERLLSDYSDQIELVAEARSRVRRLVAVETLSAPVRAQRASVSEVSVEESLLGPVLPFIDGGSSMSRDGRYVVFTDWDTFRLGYLKLGDPQIQWVTPESEESSAAWGRFSPDNSEIAYVWSEGVTGSSAIRVFNRLSGETREILNHRVPTAEEIAGVYDWTSDGRHILAELWPAPGIVRLALMDKDTGSVSHFVELNRLDTHPACLVNDRYVLFDEPFGKGGLSRVLRADLYEGSVQSFLPEGAGSKLLGCSDSKQAAAVASNETGAYVAWLYPLDAGLPSGPALHLQEVPERAVSAGGLISNDGRMLLRQGPLQETGLYRYEGDSILERIGTPVWDSWLVGFSPDGSSVAYRPRYNFVQVIEGNGETRNLNLPGGGGLRWLADGSGFVRNWTNASGPGANRINLESGLPTDTLTGHMSPGQSGVELLAAHRRDSETVCVRVYPKGTESGRDLVCYSDSRARLDGGRSAVVPGSGTLSVLARTAGGEFYRTLVDATTGQIVAVSDSHRSHGTWQVSHSGENFVLDIPRSMFRISPNGSEKWEVFNRFSELRNIIAFSLHPRENLILITSVPRAETGATRVSLLTNLWDRLD